ncbi:hypothetical protein C8R41DRAFT_869028 [Lentinula lateritia]|uniref:Uncharacterized protein n=1 Tax=Lentinula lateritia TaxID=40482 RepID=A0ABQ8VCM6_9AGAR|nr:hypothetical protein C8R41DRAFT_869028 [Lentinula lateritia]
MVGHHDILSQSITFKNILNAKDQIVEEVYESKDQMKHSIEHYWAPTDCCYADHLKCCIETLQSFKVGIENSRALSLRRHGWCSKKIWLGAGPGNRQNQVQNDAISGGVLQEILGALCGSLVTCRTLAALKLNIQGTIWVCRVCSRRLSARAIYPEVKPLQTWESELHGKFLYGLIIPWATGHCQSKTARPEFEVLVGE